MLKFFEEVADNIRAIETISKKMEIMLSIDDFEYAKLDNLYADRLVHIDYIEKWKNSNSGKELVSKHNKEWKYIFDRFISKDKVILDKIQSLNNLHKNALKDLQVNKSILIYSRDK